MTTAQPDEHWTVARHTTDNPHWLDPYDADLDAFYEGQPILGTGQPFEWALVYPLNLEVWEPPEIVTVEGPSWVVQLYPPGQLEIPEEEGNFEYAVCLVRVATGKSTLNEARDVGRSACRSIVGLLHSTGSKVLVGRSPVWEGPVVFVNANLLFAHARRRTEIPDATAGGLSATLGQASGKSVLSCPQWLSLSRYWYSRAWASDTLIDRFLNYWLAALAVIDARSNQSTQRKRIDHYVQQLAESLGLAADVSGDLGRVLKDSYELRNRLFHESDWSAATVDAVVQIEAAATEILKYEGQLNP